MPFFDAFLWHLNQQTGSMRYQCVDRLDCPKCLSKNAVKNGKSRNGTQRLLCKDCKHSFQSRVIYNAYLVSDASVVQLTRESCGIRSIGRILSISPVTVIRRILKIGRSLQRPHVFFGRTYQVDELFTYIGNKNNRVCIAYSLEIASGNVIDIVVGRRNKTNLQKIISTLILSSAAAITTDKLNIYKELIPKETHSTKFRGINRIERMNLSLRTMLKRLGRKTICYSKSLAVLTAVVKICCWYN
jgi:insertion element IS1 protein InsB